MFLLRCIFRPLKSDHFNRYNEDVIFSTILCHHSAQSRKSQVLGQPHTNCVKTSIKTWDKRDKSWRQHHDSDRCATVFVISFVSTVLIYLRHVADIVSWLLHALTHAGVRPTLHLRGVWTSLFPEKAASHNQVHEWFLLTRNSNSLVILCSAL
jgi:hypothetical protein